MLFLAGYFFDRWEFLRELRGDAAPACRARCGIPKLEYLLPPLLAIGLVLVFFFLQQDLGPALILSFLFLTLYCVARGKPWMALVGSAPARRRLRGRPTRSAIPHTVSGRAQHVALAVGQLLPRRRSPGAGALGAGRRRAHRHRPGPGQPQRVPEVHTDLVLAAVGEQLGFLGVLGGLRALRAPGLARLPGGVPRRRDLQLLPRPRARRC